jgi:hypothetical protein
MKSMLTLGAALLVAACSKPHAPDTVDSGTGTDGTDGPDPYKPVLDSVSDANLKQRLDELTGAVPVTAGGNTFSITNRWSPAAKKDFRAYWRQYMEGLGATVNESTFPISNLVGETTGHNLEAILPGASPDTLIVITHYDTVGVKGHETENPGADDAGTGLAVQLEAARIFAAIPHRTHTVRFVACDYEEIAGPTDSDFPGPDAYLAYIQHLSTTQGFKILMVSDNDQIGWSCWDENGGAQCYQPVGAPHGTFRMLISTRDPAIYAQISTAFRNVATTYGSIKPDIVPDNDTTPGDTEGTDQYDFGLAGLPAYTTAEWGDNPHYDEYGGDFLNTVNLPYLFQIAQIQIVFQGTVMGVAAAAP